MDGGFEHKVGSFFHSTDENRLSVNHDKIIILSSALRPGHNITRRYCVETGRTVHAEERRLRLPFAVGIGLLTLIVFGLLGLALATYLSIGISCFLIDGGPDCEHFF